MTALGIKPATETIYDDRANEEMIHVTCGCQNPPKRTENITLCGAREPRETTEAMEREDAPPHDMCLVCLDISPEHRGHPKIIW